MTTNADAIQALVESKAELQKQCDGADDDTLNKLITTIHNISSEIGALETAALNDAAYIPATDAFKSETEDAKSFLATLNNLKTAFGAIAQVASALDSLTNLIIKHAL